MLERNRKINFEFIRFVKQGSAGLPIISTGRQLIKRHTGIFAGIFSIAAAILVVWVWHIEGTSGLSRANSISTASVNNNSSLDNNSGGQPVIQVHNNAGGTDISVQKTGNGPASVTVNGQPVPIPGSGTVHKQIGGNSIDINVQSNSGASGSSSATSVSSHSNSFSNSSSSVNNWSYSSGGTTIHN